MVREFNVRSAVETVSERFQDLTRLPVPQGDFFMTARSDHTRVAGSERESTDR